MRQESAKERYRNIAKDLLLSNIVSQKDERPQSPPNHTARPCDATIPHVTKILHKKAQK